MNSPIQYAGGKGRHYRWLLSNVPHHKIYAELFGGSGALLFAKPSVGIEVYNDHNDLLVNLFRVLKDDDKFNQFKKLVELTLYSRKEFEYCRDNLHEPGITDIEAAHRYFVASRQSYISATSPMQSWSKTTKNPSCSGNIGNWLSVIDRLPNIHSRLQSVQIESSDFKYVLTAFDSEDTFFYCDPPYIGVDIYYQIPESEHERIVLELSKARGKVMISNYDNYPYNVLDELGWVRKEYEVNSWIDKSAPKRVECLWMNYEV